MYATEQAAKMAANRNLNPCVARMGDGQYDWFPAGHPLGRYETNGFTKVDEDARVIARWNPWRRKWMVVGS